MMCTDLAGAGVINFVSYVVTYSWTSFAVSAFCKETKADSNSVKFPGCEMSVKRRTIIELHNIYLFKDQL